MDLKIPFSAMPIYKLIGPASTIKRWLHVLKEKCYIYSIFKMQRSCKKAYSLMLKLFAKYVHVFEPVPITFCFWYQCKSVSQCSTYGRNIPISSEDVRNMIKSKKNKEARCYFQSLYVFHSSNMKCLMPVILKII